MPEKPVVYLVPAAHHRGPMENALKAMRRLKAEGIMHWGVERPKTLLEAEPGHKEREDAARTAIRCSITIKSGDPEHDYMTGSETNAAISELGVKTFKYGAPYRVYERAAHLLAAKQLNDWDIKLTQMTISRTGSLDRQEVANERTNTIKAELPESMHGDALKLEEYLNKNRELILKTVGDKKYAETLNRYVDDIREKHFVKNIEAAARKHGKVGVLIGSGHKNSVVASLEAKGIRVIVPEETGDGHLGLICDA